jgi:hypothetical protein
MPFLTEEGIRRLSLVFTVSQAGKGRRQTLPLPWLRTASGSVLWNERTARPVIVIPRRPQQRSKVGQSNGNMSTRATHLCASTAYVTWNPNCLPTRKKAGLNTAQPTQGVCGTELSSQ